MSPVQSSFFKAKYNLTMTNSAVKQSLPVHLICLERMELKKAKAFKKKTTYHRLLKTATVLNIRIREIRI